MGKKTTDNKKDFIHIIANMSNAELNQYIKRHGSQPKPVLLCKDIEKNEDGKLPKEKNK